MSPAGPHLYCEYSVKPLEPDLNEGKGAGSSMMNTWSKHSTNVYKAKQQ